MPSHHRCAVLALFASVASSCCDSSSPPPAVGSGVIGAAGGSVTVTTGNLAGTVLAVPAAALSADVLFEIRESSPSVIQGALALGPAAQFDPVKTALAQPATLTLVFDAALVPSPTTADAFRVPYRDPTGALRVAVPSAVDTVAGTATVDAPELGVFWVVVPDVVRFRDYYPLGAGDTYRYGSGMQLQVAQTTTEPNFPPAPLLKLSYVRASSRFFGEYYEEGAMGELFFRGEFDVTFESRQERVDGSVLFWDEIEIVGITKSTGFTFVGFRPYGFNVPSYSGSSSSVLGATSRTRLATPAGVFDDVIVTEWRNDRSDTRPRSEQLVSRMWLARGVGPVQLLFDDGSVEVLTSANVGGVPIP